MDTAIYNEPWKVELYEMIQRAKVERKWMYMNSIHTGPLWYSPNALEDEHKRGRFMWGVVNWSLEDPREYLADAERKVQKAIAERDRIAASIPSY